MDNQIKIIRGDDSTINFTFTDQDGAAINLTDATIFFTVKKSKNDSDNNAAFKTEVTDHTDPVNGKTQVIIPTASSAEMLGDYYWDTQIKYSNGDIQSTQAGILTCIPDVTVRTS